VRERRALGLALIEGPHLLDEAVEAGIVVREVYGLADDAHARSRAETVGGQWFECSRAVLERLSATATPRGPVAVIEIPEPGVIQRDALLAFVTDPGNAGTLIRTAAAFGFDVVLDERAVDPWAPKVLRAAAGAHFRISLASDQGAMTPDTRLIATVVSGGTPLPRLHGELEDHARYAILVGSEAHGLGDSVLERAHHRVTIPMPGHTESLNAAVAGAVVAYELMRWRNPGGWRSGRH
jgi:TrmH family RNA methyltransferase